VTHAARLVAVLEEAKRVRRLQRGVDFGIAAILQGAFTREEAERLTHALREACAELCPGKEETFDLIYVPRLRRAISAAFPTER